MNVEKIKIDDDREIDIIDDSLDIGTINNLYYDCCQLPYRIENSSFRDVQRRCDRRLKCNLLQENSITGMLLDDNSGSLKAIKKYIPNDEYAYTRGYVNLGLHSDVSQLHTDNRSKNKTLLYYANKNWEIGWGGETVFYNDRGTDYVKVVPYVPGRIVIFDGRIPHTAKPMNIRLSPTYRFTVALKFDDLNKKMTNTAKGQVQDLITHSDEV
tara:strand:+ start:379 stop:1014 length:636 start_codon:yes stop_codon:yes gene_type:complete